MRREQFQEVKIVENEKGQVSRSQGGGNWEGNNFKKLRLLKMRREQFQEVRVQKMGWVTECKKKRILILIGRIIYASSIASIYIWYYIIW